jgi:NTP pyrophosphatase (non-canonical NTP hydrolase)
MNNVEQFKKIATELGELYEKKNKAYGNSFSDTYKKLGIISAVTRISDKYNRLCNLATNPDIDNLGESLEDTLRDMASYCIMTVMELENAKPVGLDMQGNIIKRGDVIFPDLNKLIRKGDVFECIQHVVMEDGSIAYVKGKTYASEKDGCITDESHDEIHEWNIQEDDEENWWHYFKRI